MIILKATKKKDFIVSLKKTFFWKIDPQPLGMRIVSTTKRERESEQQNRNRKQWKIRIRNLEIGFVEFRLTVNTQVNFEWKMLFTVSRE